MSTGSVVFTYDLCVDDDSGSYYSATFNNTFIKIIEDHNDWCSCVEEEFDTPDHRFCSASSWATIMAIPDEELRD